MIAQPRLYDDARVRPGGSSPPAGAGGDDFGWADELYRLYAEKSAAAVEEILGRVPPGPDRDRRVAACRAKPRERFEAEIAPLRDDPLKWLALHCTLRG